jgi:hypothetical protein
MNSFSWCNPYLTLIVLEINYDDGWRLTSSFRLADCEFFLPDPEFGPFVYLQLPRILQLRRRVIPTDSEISRQHSRLVRLALETRPDRNSVPRDVWAIQGDRVRLAQETEE